MSGRSEKELASAKKMQEKLKKLPEIFSEFYYFMHSSKSYLTVERYISYTREFALFLNDGAKIENDFYKNIVPLDINKYFASMRNKEVNGEPQHVSDSIRATKWSALNAFFGFLKKNNYIKENPMDKTERPTVQDNPEVSYLTKKEINKMLKNVEESYEGKANQKMKHRDLALLTLGFSTGLRVSAIIQINVDDIDFENNVIRVIEKREKVCDVFLGDKVKEELLLWVQDRKKYFPDLETNALFISSFRSRITRDGVDKILKKYSKGATNKNVTPHVLRHSCATNLYEKTGDIYLCASMLNHKSVATTQRYANMSNEKKKQATNILGDMMKF